MTIDFTISLTSGSSLLNDCLLFEYEIKKAIVYFYTGPRRPEPGPFKLRKRNNQVTERGAIISELIFNGLDKYC
jgi:hypothetical protein